MSTFAELLVENLKALNAKERDHLMRFAYLGVTTDLDPSGAYEHTARWLSPEMTDALRRQVPADFMAVDAASCVFAGMDYHLDWLHAALLLARRGQRIADFPKPNDEGEALDAFDDTTIEAVDVSLRPVIGGQEDLDLLVVFRSAERVLLFCIEAKGVASLDRVQLARKLIRLDRILTASGASPDAHFKCKLVLLGPAGKQPMFDHCLDYARELPFGNSSVDKFARMRKPLQWQHHPTEIGRHMNFVELKGFPKDLRKITRFGRINAAAGAFTHWRITKR